MIDQRASDPIDDALIAARLFASHPHLFGGMVLRGAGPARDALLSAIAGVIPCRRLPGHIDDTRLMGGIDIAASLASGKPVKQKGLLAEAKGGALVLPMAERCEAALAGRLAQALDADEAALILLDDGNNDDDAPPQALTERLAFSLDLSASRRWQDVALPPPHKTPSAKVAPLGSDGTVALANTAAALGIVGLRPLIFASHAARAHASLKGRSEAIDADLAAAVRLVLAPRATQLPQPQDQEQPPEPPPPPSDNPGDEPKDNDTQQPDGPLEDMLVEAALAAIPADLIAQLAQGNAPRRAGMSGSGQNKKSGLRGKPLGARPGMPRGGARLALIDTLRAAVPWQEVRRTEMGREVGDATSAIQVRKDDLRIRRFEEKSARVTIFAVDASGSAAAARLAEAKGAVELMLAQAYVTRSEVALIAFRGESAELLLPPTRSLTRARRALAELPGGGGTPLAMGLNAARETAEAVIARGRTASVIVLTDGRANIAADGTPGRKQAGEDAEAAAKAIARAGIEALVVDIAARPGREGPQLAQAMGARFLALPRADAKALHAAIDTSTRAKEPA
ncbi:magnesium chelatase subunit D [Erythrobacter sp. YT30]|uniref:magnesium chelatase subunit D n=1 Tax=Erythrobacter sp. YT30 TaxID=1735012 RepID=UPI00076D60BD|nr:magnesium chelatase subunit D [Erythrobacter sp. YT30]KWV90892.1 magnesium chelatase [Erythrobacter sp. YT30]